MKIEVRKITKKFKEKVAVSNISFEMRKGQTLGLLGPNGSGKSTTIKMLTGEIKPTSGKITYDGENIVSIKDKIKTFVGIMPQEIIIWEHLSVRENIEFSGTLYGLSKKDIKSRTKFLLKKLHLGAEKDTLARKLSGGFKRRLHLAISIVHDPKVIFLDEPTPGIDPQSRRAMWEFIDELKNTGEYSILLTDHYLDEAEKACDYIIIIDNGKLVTEGTMKELKKKHGNGKIITIDLIDSPQKISNKIKKQFKKVIIHDKKVTIPTQAPEKDFPSILEIINLESIKFDDISIKEPSLEDIFLLLTGKEIRS